MEILNIISLTIKSQKMKINIVIGHTDFRGRCLLETLYTQHNVKYAIIFGQHIVMSEPYVFVYIFRL